MNWKRAKVGLYWTGEQGFHISSYGSGKRSGYMLYNGYNMLGLYPSLEEAKEAAEPHVQVGQVEGEVRS